MNALPGGSLSGRRTGSFSERRTHLANPHVDQQACQELFGLNETEAARIATLVPRQECLLTQPGVARVLRLVTDPESAALFSAGTD